MASDPLCRFCFATLTEAESVARQICQYCRTFRKCANCHIVLELHTEPEFKCLYDATFFELEYEDVGHEMETTPCPRCDADRRQGR